MDWLFSMDGIVAVAVIVLLGLLWVTRQFFAGFFREIGKQHAQPEENSAPAETGARHQLPPDLPDFQGREDDIKTLLGTFTKAGGGAAAVVSALGGMGGVGKTALAVHVAHRLKGTYPDAQIVVDMQGLSETPLAPEAAMARVVQAFDPGFSPPEDAAQLAAIYRSTLAGSSALLILDNARDAAQVRDLMPPPPSAAMVTSRARIALPGAGSIDLDAMPPEEAKDLLAAVLAPERTLTDGEAEALAEACFRLPLALRAAGAYLKGRPEVAVADYVSGLGDERKRLGKLKYDPAGLDVGAALGLSAKQLERDDADLAARWRMLAAFPAGFDAPAAAAVWGAGEESDEERVDSAGDALADLVARSLLQFNAGRKRWRLHDLMRDLARLEAAEEGDDVETAARRHAEHFVAVLATADALYQEGDEKVLAGLALADSEWSNITAGQAWAAANAETDDAAAALCNQFPNAGVYVLSLRLHPRERISWLEAALAAARRLADRKMEEGHLGNLGLAYAQLGEPRRAIECYEQALEIAREVGDRRGEGNSLGNLGNAYAYLDEPRRAIEYYEQRLEIACEISDRRGESNVLGNLGGAYAALDEPRRAIDYYKQALKIDQVVGDLRGEGSTLWNWALALGKLGDKAGAIEKATAAVAIKEEIEDPDAAEDRARLESWKAKGG